MMLVDFLKERGKFIFIQGEEDSPVAQLKDAVIDPLTGKISAWWVMTLEGLRLVFPEDCLRWTAELIVIHSENDFHAVKDMPKIQKVLDREVRLLGSAVFCKDDRIGQVQNFTFRTLSPKILSIMVASGWMWWKNPRIISAEAIEKITEAGVFVSSLYNKVKIEKKSPIVNVVPPIELD